MVVYLYLFPKIKLRIDLTCHPYILTGPIKFWNILSNYYTLAIVCFKGVVPHLNMGGHLCNMSTIHTFFVPCWSGFVMSGPIIGQGTSGPVIQIGYVVFLF